MLVISRKAEEFVQIGENIVVKIIKCSNGSVKIGIDAPGNLRVLRGELQDTPIYLSQPLSKRSLQALQENCEMESATMAEVL